MTFGKILLVDLIGKILFASFHQPVVSLFCLALLGPREMSHGFGHAVTLLELFRKEELDEFPLFGIGRLFEVDYYAFVRFDKGR
jgi:hypothetical protein